MNQNVDDVGFIDNLLDTLFLNYLIDTTRVYATGSSNGGMLCYRLACELSHRFAAIAPNACSQMYFPCNPTNKIPVINFHSKVDPIVFYNGGMGGAPPLTTIYFPSQDSTLNLWTQSNNCQSRDTVINGNGTNYDFIKIHNCSCNVEIHHYATTDGSHSWPGGNPNNNPVSTQISATDLLWSFFQNYTLGCLTTGLENSSEANSKIEVFPNPFSNKIYVKNASENEILILENYFGQIIWLGKNIEKQDFSNLSNGLYFLRFDNYTLKLVKQ
jgi:polyhydroxybutyrate depolymerase